MPRLQPRAFETLDPTTQRALAPVLERGPLADVWLEFAASEPALRAYLGMEAALVDGTLEPREIEAIKLLVSAHNDCDFCIGTHRAKGRAAGLDTGAQRKLLAGEALGEVRLDALLAIARHLLRVPGTVPTALIEVARAADIADATLMDLTMAMAAIHFTNIANHVNATGT